jgi:hypothetical protein
MGTLVSGEGAIGPGVKAPTLQALIDRAKGSGHVGAYVEFFTVIIRNKNICERRLSCDGARIGASFGLVDEPGAKHRIGKALITLLISELRHRRIVVPVLPVLERLTITARSRARR